MARKSGVSKPMQVVAVRLTGEERAKLERVAREHDVTLSWVIRQGAKLYAEDLSRWLDEHSVKGPVDGRIAPE